MTAQPNSENCPHCGAKDAQRLISKFARLRSEDDRIDEISDHVEAMGEPESPSEMRKMMREMGKAMDEDFSDDMEQAFEADMAGELDDD